METQYFIVIDDDAINNSIFSKIIGLTVPGASVYTYTDPREGMQHLLSVTNSQPGRTVVFLDIVMPVLNCWDILDRVGEVPGFTKDKLVVYLISPLLSEKDYDRLKNYPLVAGYITKPLTMAKLKEILD